MGIGKVQIVESRVYASVLGALTILFLGRVLAQFLQIWQISEALPSFEEWQSGALSYEVLFFTQCLILLACSRITWCVWRRGAQPSRIKGKFLLGFGSLYFCSMLLRLAIGWFWAPNHYWFGATLPAIFHLGLASFVLVYGHFHFVKGHEGQGLLQESRT